MKKRKRLPALVQKRIRQKNATTEKRNGNVLSIIANICTIITFIILVLGSIYGYTSLKDYSYNRKYRENSKAAVSEWKKELDVLRIGNNVDFIEKRIGAPNTSYEIDFRGNAFNKCIYVNEYFTLICFYNNSSLFGFLIIGNNEKFNFTNYRCNYSLFDYTIKDAESYCMKNSAGSILLLKNNCSGRIDCNNYYLECNMQRSQSAGGIYVVGYGVTDIGFIKEFNRFDKCFSNMKKVSFCGPNSTQRVSDIKNADDNDEIRQAPINALLIFDDNYAMAIDFISECVAMSNMLGINREEFANQQKNYRDAIKKYNVY